ncbi:MAG TPA: hypothetical protein ENJ01_02110 [Gammaproteobacteria bacterium]|nr:hypothetical protein [Gammaproteobacteria bacterium]
MDLLNAETRTVSSLSSSEAFAMFELYKRYYDACDQARFEADLNGKDYVVLLKDVEGIFRGFSTLAVYRFEYEGTPRRALYSGDTVIHHDYWGSQALPLAWCQLAGRIKAEDPDIPLYWFLIVKGHRTYRYLSVFSRRFYPTWRYATPADTQAIMDHLAREKFGEHYNAQRGVIHFDRSHGHLKPDWAVVPSHLQRKPDVNFFLQRNPGYAHGDELVCLTELCAENLRSHALRAFQAAMT